ncbi:MAG: hypothetical protein AAF629_14720 [Chloroflexota bacterium]
MATNQKTRQRTPWENWGISKVEFDVFIAKGKARQANAPKQGTPAPDFEIERLDDHGKQTGQMFRLSSDFGKPIALIFGSYT